ncbi:MAG: hypothetical protein Q4B15_07865 [Lachnospiraceae bacterium]|nr:hypothetical protein [Lachnospiraceae bacterium]
MKKKILAMILIGSMMTATPAYTAYASSATESSEDLLANDTFLIQSAVRMWGWDMDSYIKTVVTDSMIDGVDYEIVDNDLILHNQIFLGHAADIKVHFDESAGLLNWIATFTDIYESPLDYFSEAITMATLVEKVFGNCKMSKSWDGKYTREEVAAGLSASDGKVIFVWTPDVEKTPVLFLGIANDGEGNFKMSVQSGVSK